MPKSVCLKTLAKEKHASLFYPNAATAKKKFYDFASGLFRELQVLPVSIFYVKAFSTDKRASLLRVSVSQWRKKSFTTLTNAMFCSWNLSSATANFSKAANLSLYFITLSRYLILTFSVFFKHSHSLSFPFSFLPRATLLFGLTFSLSITLSDWFFLTLSLSQKSFSDHLISISSSEEKKSIKGI